MSSPLTIPADIQPLLDTPVAVIGHGVSGQAIGGLVSRIGAHCAYYDLKSRSASHEFNAAIAAKHKLVVFSPGFEIDHPWLEIARKAGCVTMGEMEFGARFWDGKLYCVTGSNGKTTTTELLVSAFNASGISAFGVGNIGRPLSDIALRAECAGKTAICETSSFQAESADSLKIDGLIWLNLYDNHLDRHGSMKAYFAAKWKLVERLRAPVLVIGESVAKFADEFGYKLPDYAQVVGPGSMEPWPMPRTSAYNVLKQAENLLLARSFWTRLGMNSEILRKCAENLEPLPFRMNLLPGPDGITFWNDSKATNYAACFGALENFKDKVVWIGGGKNRGENPETLATGLAPRVKVAILTGETAYALRDCLARKGVPTKCVPSLADAVLVARHAASPGDNVLFSPAHSSHDAYRDYMERGRHFESLVARLGDPAARLPNSDSSKNSSGH
jgi:UDP-N-acetylmuramoylalanine--D-glutamate ligase